MSLCMYDAKALCRFSDVARINRTLKEILQCFLVTAIPIRFRFYCHTQQPLSLLFRDCLPEKHCFYDQTCFLRDDVRQHDTSCLIAKYILPVSQHDLKNRGHKQTVIVPSCPDCSFLPTKLSIIVSPCSSSPPSSLYPF